MLGSTGTSTNSPPTAPPTDAESSWVWRRHGRHRRRRIAGQPHRDQVTGDEPSTPHHLRRRNHPLSGGRIGEPVVLLHRRRVRRGCRNSLGTSPALAERCISAGAGHARPAGRPKVVDFTDGRGMRSAHRPVLCGARHLGPFVGKLRWGRSTCFVDLTSEGSGHCRAQCGSHLWWRDSEEPAHHRLYDTTPPRTACGRSWRHCSSIRPTPPTRPTCGGALRVQHRPRCVGVVGGSPAFAGPVSNRRRPLSSTQAYRRIARCRSQVVEGAGDKLLPAGWAAEIAGQIVGARCAIVEGAGHCPFSDRAAGGAHRAGAGFAGASG